MPRALIEKMYKRQVEDEVARDLVEHSIGQAIRENQIQPVAPPTVEELEIKSGAPFKFTARVEVRSQVTPKDYSGLPLSRRPAKVTDEAGRRGAGGLPAPADRVQAGRGAPADRRHRPGAGRDVRPGGGQQAQEAPGRDRLENDAEGPLPGLPSRLRGKPIGGEPVEVEYTLPPEGARRAEMAGKQVHLHVTIKEAREKKVPALDDEMAKDTGEAETLEGLRGKVRERLRRGRRAAHQGRDDPRADQGAGQAQRVRRSRPR